jgi:Papain-like cysteine protease AvrRpt2
MTNSGCPNVRIVLRSERRHDDGWSAVVLNFTIQQQEEDNWCWAACGASTGLFFQSASGWTQCAVANGELGRADCCATPVPNPCNVYGYLDQALAVVGHFDHMDGTQEPEAVVFTEICAGRPLGVRIAWSGGGAHFVMCIGDDNAGTVTVADPFYGTSTIPFGTLQSGYQGSGTWTHSYFTQS